MNESIASVDSLIEVSNQARGLGDGAGSAGPPARGAKMIKLETNTREGIARRSAASVHAGSLLVSTPIAQAAW
jgi:hypothetical protein